MSQILKFLRFYFVLLGFFTIGRLGLGFGGVPYEKGHYVFSLVILAMIASAHHGAFARGLLGWRFGRIVGVGVAIGLSTQIVIFVLTAVSYMAGLETYFNYPTALNVKTALPFGAAMLSRSQTLVINSILNGIAASIGWLMGGALPRREDLA